MTQEATTPVTNAPRSAPDILAYLDYRLFLRDRLDYLHSVDKKFSGRWVAKRAGFKAPQLLPMIVAGQRNLTREKADDLAIALKLDARESEYFGVLIELAEAASHNVQAALLAKIQAKFKEGLFAAIPDEGIEIFRRWYIPAIREIILLKDAKPTPEWIAERLGIKQAEAAEGLDLLLTLGFLKRDGDLVTRAEPSVRTSRQKVYPSVLGQYHMQVLEKAFQSVLLGRDRRHFESLAFSIPKRLMPQLKESIQRFFREVDMLVEAEPESEREEVCLMQVGLFPLTRWHSAETPGPKGGNK